MKHRYLRSAANEFSRAVDYYLDVDPLLAKRFVREVEASLRRILTHPHAWKPLGNEFRRCRVKHFPYGLVYRVERDAIIIVLIMHLQRHPESWRNNLGSSD